VSMAASASEIKKYITPETTLFWFRRDLRIQDNAGLYYALKENNNVLCVFIFDIVILEQLEDRHDRRVMFIHQSLQLIKQSLEEIGTSLLIVHDNPVNFYKTISPKAVYANEDYEPYARKRDEAVGKLLQEKGSFLNTFKDQVIFSKDEILKDDRAPYTIFTPYNKKWKAALKPFYYKSYPTEKYFKHFLITDHLSFPTLQEIGFEKTPVDFEFPERKIKTSIVTNYEATRDYPALAGTSKLSVHLRFGTVSIRKLVQLAVKKNQAWLNELIWRDFYHMILWHFPDVEHALKIKYERIKWRNNENDFRAWCEGMTGYPIVDAGMRELNSTGFMHNRVRMIVASFLTKHLLIDWRWGEAYFAKKLLDFDLAANNGGWQWAAGCGCDAAPYFRVFNPELQTKKFDPDLTYIKKWVPELGTEKYPKPIVDHKLARDRVLKAYQLALEK
jgi:deoxyribodipyrimidine photo-lyase